MVGEERGFHQMRHIMIKGRLGETPGTPVPRVISSTAILSAKTTQTIESIG
jgi:hypothetical protein